MIGSRRFNGERVLPGMRNTRRLMPLGGSPRVKSVGNAQPAAAGGVGTRVPESQPGASATHEPPGGSPRVKSAGNAQPAAAGRGGHQGAETQPGASARPLRGALLGHPLLTAQRDSGAAADGAAPDVSHAQRPGSARPLRSGGRALLLFRLDTSPTPWAVTCR
ncbi:MAG: hypothetical protein RLZZ436_2860 [Planctomycetota bacterium]|jgi:hypothetical protein